MNLQVEYRGVILDWDGTVADSLEAEMGLMLRVSQDMGLNHLNMDVLRDIWGSPWQKFPEILSGRLGWQITLAKYFKEVVEKRYHELEYGLIPGALEAIEQLHARGFKLAILTNRNREFFSLKADEVRFPSDHFEIIQTIDDWHFHKPNSRSFQPIIFRFSELGILPHQVLSIGDSYMYDLPPARNHSPPISFMAVLSIISTRDEFISAGQDPDMITESIAELPQLLGFS